MQTISVELQAILKSKFQAAASGFRGRMIVIVEAAEAIACSSGVISGLDTWADPTELDSIGAYGGPVVVTPVLSVPPGQPSLARIFWVGRRTDTSMVSGDTGAVSGWDELWTTRDGDTGGGGIGILGGLVFGEEGGDLPPATFTWVGNDIGPSGGHHRAFAVTIPTTEGPIHHGSQMGSGGSVVLDGLPTEGNLFIAYRMTEETEGPPGGWTEIVSADLSTGFGGTSVACWAKCVDATDALYASVGIADNAKAHWTYLEEYALSEFGTIETILPPPKRISIDKSLRLAGDQAEVEFENEDLALGWGPTAIIKTNQRIAIEQWYGDEANAIRTFTGLVDRISDHRDVLTTSYSCRDLMALLLDQTFSTTGPQGADEDGAVRTEANGVYLNREVSYIVTDILTRAGWRVDHLDIVETSYVLDEFIISDGASWASAIVGDTQLTGLVGYSAWSDENGFFHFAPTLVSSNFTDPPTPSYVFRSGEDVVSLDDETDQYDLRTRVKVRGPLTTRVLQDTWRELWRTTKLHLPVGIWYNPAEPTIIRVIDRGTKRLYAIRQSDRAITGSVYLGSVIPHPLGLSGDPSDGSIYWVLNAPWIDGGSGGNSVKKVRKSDHHVLATYSLPSGRWSAIKVSAAFIWLTNLDTDRFYKRSKTDASAISSYQHTVSAVVQANPSGLMVDGTTLYLFWANGGTTARFLVCDESAPTTITKIVQTAGTNLHGGEMDTTTHTECYGDSDSLGLVAKFTLVAAVDQTSEVFAEVVDIDLEDELGDLAIVENREHDAHPTDPDHQFEIRRMTLDLTVITNLAQATQTAQRQLDIASQRRRVVDAGIVGNPALQKTDYVAVVDVPTGISTGFAVDTYRTEMSADGTYLGTIALLPVEAITDTPTDDGDAVDEGS